MAPLSAFAARQARKAARVPEEDKPVGVELDVSAEITSRPRESKRLKRRRKQSPTRSIPETHIQDANTSRMEPDVAEDSGDAAISYANGDDIMDYSSNLESDSLLEEPEDVSRPQIVPRHAPLQRICTVREPNVLVELGKKGFTLSLGVGDTVAFSGMYLLRVDRGVVRIFGATIKESPKAFQVFAPSTHCLPVIEHVQNPFGISQPAEISILHTAPEVDHLESLHPYFENIWNVESIKEPRSFAFLHKQTDDPYGRIWSPFHPPQSWQATLLKLTELQTLPRRKILICGPKGAGKSTFARYLTNALLSLPAVSESKSAAGLSFLDLDPGQPEFSPPGDMSLSTLSSFTLSPSFTHPLHAYESGNRIEKAYHFGAVSPRKDLKLYMDVALELTSANLRTRRQRPLVVNTCGWIQGRGLDVLSELVGAVQATDIVWLSKTGPAETVNALSKQSAAHGATLHLIDSAEVTAADGASARTSADLRAMQTMSYFHLDSPVCGTQYWRASRRALSKTQAQTLRCTGHDADVAGIMLAGAAIDPRHLPSIVSGSVLGLVALNDLAALPSPIATQSQVPDDSDAQALPYLFRGIAVCDPLPPGVSRALGQVLVCSVDGGTLQLYSPLKLDQVCADARAAGTPLVLVRGSLDVPAWFYTEEHYASAAQRAVEREYVRSRWAEVTEAGGRWDNKGVWGPKGESWTVAPDRDVQAHARRADDDGGSVPDRWLQLNDRTARAGARERGDKVWRVRRNLEMKDSGRTSKAKT